MKRKHPANFSCLSRKGIRKAASARKASMSQSGCDRPLEIPKHRREGCNLFDHKVWLDITGERARQHDVTCARRIAADDKTEYQARYTEPEKALLMLMAIRLRPAEWSSRESAIVTLEEVNLGNGPLWRTGNVTVMMQTSMYHIGCATSLWTITLFDSGAHASFVNCEIAAWIVKQFVPGKQLGARKRGRQEDEKTSVALARTSLSSQILESVVFDLTFLNEVTRHHVNIKDIYARVIDSCIAVIIGRYIIRGNHLVQKKIPSFLRWDPKL